MASSTSSGLSPIPATGSTLALQLKTLLKDVNNTFVIYETRKYLVIQGGNLKITYDILASSTVAELSKRIFDKLLVKLAPKSRIRVRLFHEIQRYVSFFTEAQDLHLQRKNLMEEEVLSEKSTKIVKAASPKTVQFNETADHPMTSILKRNEVSSFAKLADSPCISIEDLTNVFQKKVCKILKRFYMETLTKNEKIDPTHPQLAKVADSLSHKMTFYLANAFLQNLSKVTDSIETSVEKDEIVLLKTSLEQLNNLFQESYSHFQSITKADVKLGMPYPLQPSAIHEIQNLLDKHYTQAALITYFQQVISEKAS